MIANGDVPSMSDEDTVYYVPFNCIEIDKGGKSPNGDWDFAYVIVTSISTQRKYFIYSKDVKKQAAEGIENRKIKLSDIVSTNNSVDDLIAVDGKKNISLIPDTCSYGDSIIKDATNILIDKCFTMYPAKDAPHRKLKSWNVTTIDDNDPCYMKDLIIPAEIDGLLMTEIQTETFANKGLTSVVIPEAVTVLNDSTFMNNKLKHVKIPSGVTTIENRLFRNNELETVEWSNKIKYISAFAFENNKLKKVDIPPIVNYIGLRAFANNNIEELYLPTALPLEISGLAFSNNNSTINNLVIPSNVSLIHETAFKTSNISSLVISEGITEIDKVAFAESGINSLSLPYSLKIIREQAFTSNNITNVNIPYGVTTIEEQAFAGNFYMNARIPSTVNEISWGAFMHANSIELLGRSTTNGMILVEPWPSDVYLTFSP